MADMIKKLRHRRGGTHHRAKLTDEQVVKIRERQGCTQIALAKEFGVTSAQISNIRLNKQRRLEL